MFPTSAVFRAGLAAFTKIFTDTHAADNIRMNNVLPGWTTACRSWMRAATACR
jgi:NAD(P)-dependent dehydrogenase (short-subunit alcohol dehydrogenase family)